MTMCACILHKPLIEHPVPQDWLDRNDLELDKMDELNQPASYSEDERHNHIFAYMLEII